MARILVVDDEPAILKVTTIALTRAGHEVRSVTSGAESLPLAREWKPDLAIVDVMMPEKGGVETIVELRQENPKLRIIIVTGKVRADAGVLEQLASSFGSGKVLYKPVSNAQLLEAVAAMTGGSAG
jgi:CheY-like chemotaxis protein